jgi:hypothetical protein
MAPHATLRINLPGFDRTQPSICTDAFPRRVNVIAHGNFAQVFAV